MPVEGLRMDRAFAHEPVMVHEVVDLLAAVPAGVVLDATVGGGGHAEAILEAYPDLALLGLDRDPDAVVAARSRLGRFGPRVVLRHGSFGDLGEIVEAQRSLGGQAWPQVEHRDRGCGLAGALLDLGVSSPQLDRPERGFSFRHPGPLDMRMDPTRGRTAADLVNTASREDLAALLAANGEARLAWRLAGAIVAARPLGSTDRLAEVVAAAVPARGRRRGHPARRVFQALRVAVNEELDQLARAIPALLDLLTPRGRMVVISYHSGEDRLVKGAFEVAVRGGCQCPPGLPCVCGATPEFQLVFRGSRRPSPGELSRNRRSGSARLRALERIAQSTEADR